MQKGTIALTVALATLAVIAVTVQGSTLPEKRTGYKIGDPIQQVGEPKSKSLRNLPPKLTAKELMKMANLDGTGRLSFNDANYYYLHQHKYRITKKEFRRIDRDHDGFLSLSEIATDMMITDRELQPQIKGILRSKTCRQFIENADTDEDGKLSIQDAYAYLEQRDFEGYVITMTRFDLIRDGIITEDECDEMLGY